MNLKQFAELAGIEVIKNTSGYGGKYAYTLKDNPHTMMYGFNTKSDAREYWLQDTFGENTASAIKTLLGVDPNG